MKSPRTSIVARRVLRARRLPIVISYALSLLTTIGMLVFWVVYVLRSSQRVAELAARLGIRGENVHWTVLWVGCLAFFLLIVTLTYQAAQALSARTRSLQQQEFLSNVTHELKSPLAAIRLHAQTLEQEGIDEERRQKFVATILEQVSRMSLLVDNVLESSRLRSKRRPTELQSIDLLSFLEAFLQEKQTDFERFGVECRIDLRTEAFVRATPDALRRIVGNLLDNAIRHGDEVTFVACRVIDRSQKVQISIEDDGAGIPKRELTKIFDRFYQIRPQGEGHRAGTGLGLSIVRGLSRELGGSVRAHALEPRGTRFEVELPIANDRPKTSKLSADKSS